METMTALDLVNAAGTVLFSLDDWTGAANPHSLKTRLRTLDLGAPNREASLFSPSSVPGAIRTRVKHGEVVGQAVLSVESTSSDELLAGHGELSRLLEMDGIALRLQANGQTSPRLIDVADATLDRLLRGGDREGVVRFFQFYDAELGITFVRQPFLRGAELDSDTNKLKNSTLLFDSNADGRPDEWAWLSATNISAESIDAPTEAYKFNIATTSARSLQQQSAVGSFASGDVATFSFYVKAASAGVISARGAVQFYQADGTTAVGSENVGTLTDIGTSWTRITVTTSAAGALTSRATVSIRFENDATTDTAVWVRRAQLEEASAASTFITSSEIVPNDPFQEKTQNPIPPVATNPVLAGNVNGGLHSWKVSFVTGAGETLPSNKSNVLIVDGAVGGANEPGKVDLIIPTGSSEVTTRKIYRTVVGDTGNYKLVATVADNTATTYQDNTADASLGADAPASNTTTTNNRIGRLYPILIQGDAATSVTFELEGDTGGFIQTATLASLSALEDGGKSLARFANGPRVFQCEDADFVGAPGVTAPGGTASGSTIADPDASSDEAVQFALGISPFRRLFRWEEMDTDALEGFRGTFAWKLRLRYTGKAHCEFQLRWADSLEEPAPFTNLPVRHNTDLDGLATFGYVEINLGNVALPTEGTLDGLSLEVWGRVIVTGTIAFDCLIATPTEQSATVALPYTGRAVVGEDDPTVDLGNKLGANTWRVTWRYSVQAPTSTFVIALRVRRDTQDTGTIVRELQKDHPNDITNVTASLEFDSLDAVAYFADTDTFAGSATITVHEIIVEKVNWLALNEVLETDPSLGVDRARKLTTTGRVATTAVVGGPMPFWLAPGLHLIYVDVSEPRIGGLYSELKSELRRNPTLSHRYSPRYPA